MDLPEIKGNHRKFRTLVTSYIGKNAMFTCSHLFMRIIVIRLHSHHIWVFGLIWFILRNMCAFWVSFSFRFVHLPTTLFGWPKLVKIDWLIQTELEVSLLFFHSNWIPIWFIFSFDLSPCECPCVLSFLDEFSFQKCVDVACISSIYYRREEKWKEFLKKKKKKCLPNDDDNTIINMINW